jgi:hypothetical protein
MITETHGLDTTELEQRVKCMYEEVALEPERGDRVRRLRDRGLA